MTWRLGHPILVAFVILVFGRQQQQHQHSTVSIQKIHVFLSHDFCSALFTESACLESGLPAMIVFIPNSDGPWNGLQFCRILRRWTWRILRGFCVGDVDPSPWLPDEKSALGSGFDRLAGQDVHPQNLPPRLAYVDIDIDSTVTNACVTWEPQQSIDVVWYKHVLSAEQCGIRNLPLLPLKSPFDSEFGYRSKSWCRRQCQNTWWICMHSHMSMVP